MNVTTQSNKPVEQQEVHNRENSWFDGKKWIPVDKMSNSHLRKAKMFAQKRELQHWQKSSEYNRLVEMLDKEGERRKIKLKDYPSQFHQDARRTKLMK